MSALSVIWFALAALLLAAFAVLDGFDLGAGVLYGFSRRAEDRKLVLDSISPVNNGNEIFLLSGIGALLASFPAVYAALLSSLYVPVVLVFVGLLFRAVGLELRTKVEGGTLAALLSVLFSLGAGILALAVGLTGGNVLLGIPLLADGSLSGSFLFFLRPLAILAALVSLTAFTLHGTLFVSLHAGEGQLPRLRSKALGLLIALATLLAAAAILFPSSLSQRLSASGAAWAFWASSALALLGMAGTALFLARGKRGPAFASSCATVAGLALAPAGLLFPVLIPSSADPAASLTVAGSAAGPATLTAMLVITLIALPLILLYLAVAYRSFRGRA